MTKVIFIGATGTDIGKTYVTCQLLRQLQEKGYNARAIKPIISGFDPAAIEQSDTGQLLIAMGIAPTLDNAARISPWRYGPPLPPHRAAEQVRDVINLEQVIEFCQQQAQDISQDIGQDTADGPLDFLLIEGVGGVMVPLNSDHTTLDLMTRLDCRCLLVTGSYLGTLSHSLTAIDCLTRRGIEIAGLIVSESSQSTLDLVDVVRDFSMIIPHIPLEKIPRHNQTAEIFKLVL